MKETVDTLLRLIKQVKENTSLKTFKKIIKGLFFKRLMNCIRLINERGQ